MLFVLFIMLTKIQNYQIIFLVNVIQNSKRRAAVFGDAYPFPPIPDTADIFVSQNLTWRLTFFGCDVNDGVTPLIIYIANGGPFGQKYTYSYDDVQWCTGKLVYNN